AAHDAAGPDPRPAAAPSLRDGRVEQRTYALELTHATRIGEAAPSVSVLRGRWIEAGDQVRLEGLTLSPKEAPAALAGQASRPARVLRQDGSVSGMAFASDTPGDARALLKSVVAMAQITEAPRGSTSWSALEQDGSGTFEATYRRTARGAF